MQCTKSVCGRHTNAEQESSVLLNLPVRLRPGWPLLYVGDVSIRLGPWLLVATRFAKGPQIVLNLIDPSYTLRTMSSCADRIDFENHFRWIVIRHSDDLPGLPQFPIFSEMDDGWFSQ